ncbi:MAG: BstYI [Candidatus Eremiobacteraeota bacterium]|nr:BstYI [Candidatus Eremiobacteraeota bacterium]
MKKVYEYSHLGGSEILQVRHPQIDAEINEVIAGIQDVPKSKRSKEKTKGEQMLYSPVWLNNAFRKGLNARGFHELKLHFEVRLPEYPVIIKNAFKQIDFAKGRVLTEVQFGKYAFMFYDMAKFQYFFNEEKADVGIEIVPCRGLSKQMSTGVSYGEQLVGDILRLRRHFPAVPIKVILIDVDDAAPLVSGAVEVPEEETLADQTTEPTDDA